MILFKYKNRAESFLRNHPLVESWYYEEGERETDEGDIVDHERVWVCLIDGYTFGSSDSGAEYMFSNKMIKNDFETIYDKNGCRVITVRY